MSAALDGADEREHEGAVRLDEHRLGEVLVAVDRDPEDVLGADLVLGDGCAGGGLRRSEAHCGARERSWSAPAASGQAAKATSTPRTATTPGRAWPPRTTPKARGAVRRALCRGTLPGGHRPQGTNSPWSPDSPAAVVGPGIVLSRVVCRAVTPRRAWRPKRRRRLPPSSRTRSSLGVGTPPTVYGQLDSRRSASPRSGDRRRTAAGRARE